MQATLLLKSPTINRSHMMNVTETRMNETTNPQAKKSTWSFWSYLAIVAGGWYLLTPISDKFVMGGEASAGGYAIVATEYTALSPKAQGRIAAYYNKGYLTRYDVTNIISLISAEKPGGVQVYPAPNMGDTEESTTSWMWHRVTGERAKYHSKQRLEMLLRASTEEA